MCRRTDRTTGLLIGMFVIDDPPGNIKLMDDMMFYEVNNYSHFNFGELYNIRQLRELIS